MGAAGNWVQQIEEADTLSVFVAVNIREKEMAQKEIRVKLMVEAKILMARGERCYADQDWPEAALTWEEAKRAVGALVHPGAVTGVVMVEECSYQMALCLREKELPGVYMQELRKLEADGQLVSTRRRVKAKIAEAPLLDDAEEAVWLAKEVKRLGKPRGVADSA